MVGRSVGHYRLLEKLGAGGMGEVWLAEDLRLHRQVALKTLTPERSAQPRSLERFRREARLVAALNHPNIVTVHSVEEHEGLHFLTMELVRGSTLAALIPPEGMALDRILELGVPLADALAAAHAKGIVHRDLKPANVMVSHDGRVKVLDFGIAKPAATEESTVIDGESDRRELLTGTGQILGTPAYMSPEQVLGQSVDYRTDVFSLGALLFQMATGRTPFPGASGNDLLRAILRDTPPPASSLNPRVPEILDDLIARCLAKERGQRVQSAREIHELLRGLLSSSTAAQPALLAADPARPASPHRSWHPAATARAISGWMSRFLAGAPSPSRQVAAPFSSPAEKAARSSRGLAVLPLGNFSHDPEYFVDGMTDALIASLSELQGARVISRQSVMRFKGSSEPLPAIARKLDVDLIVQGSVMREGDRVRISAQLIRADPEKQIWARSYERDFRNVLALQKDVAAAISHEIQLRLEPASRRPAAIQTVDPEAYDAYLRGRYALGLRTRTGYATALDCFQEALHRDPTFAPAHAGLAELHSITSLHGVADPATANQEARLHARCALQLDPDLADAHVSLGLVQLYANRDWDGAEASFRRVIALRPSHPEAHHYYALYLLVRDRWMEAMEQFRRHLELDPLSPSAHVNLGMRAFLEGRADEALRYFQKAQTLAPDYYVAYLKMSDFHRLQGNPAKDFEFFRKVLELRHPRILPALDQANREGGRAAALRVAAVALEDELAPPEDLARIYLRLGLRDKAIDCLEEAYRRGFAGALLFEASKDWDWDILRAEPRFRALVQRIRQSPDPSRDDSPGSGQTGDSHTTLEPRENAAEWKPS